jgi:hypothetical protein
MVSIMKHIKEPKLLKVRVKNGGDTYYTFSNWETKEIEGVTFVPVNKMMPSQSVTQQIHYLRKDWLEYVK